MAGKERRLLDGAVATLLGLGALALYGTTLAPTVLAGDGGEFQFAPFLLAVVHPTGYPLYSLLGWAWSHLLPVGDVAYRMNLFSALWAALAVALLYPTARCLLRQAVPGLSPAAHRLSAALAAVTLAVTPTFWSQASIAEVYGLQIFLFVLLLNLLMSWAEGRRTRDLLLAAFCFGLGLAHHRTTLLLAPAILAYLWLTDRRLFRDRRLLLGGAACLVVPLAFYLYIPLRAPHTPYFYLPLSTGTALTLYDNTTAGFVTYIMGGPFGAAVDLSVNLGERLAMAGGLLLQEVGWVGVGLALAGLVHLVATRHVALLALTGLSYAAVVAFNLVYTIGDIYVLFIPSYLILVLWLAVGVAELAFFIRRPVVATAVLLLFFLLPLWMGISHRSGVDQGQNTQAGSRWQTILSEPLPAGAILVSNDRNDIMPMWYFQYVDRQRPDLLGLFPLIRADYPAIGHVLDLALSTGRPVFLIKDMPGIEVKVTGRAEGSLWRVLGPAAQGEPEHALGYHLANAMELVGYDRLPHSPQAGEALQVRLYWKALGPSEVPYHSFVHLVDAEGQKVAQSDRQPGGVFYPTTLWRPGERLRDDHELAIPPGTPPGTYRLLVGMYALAGDGSLQPLGQPVMAGEIQVSGDEG